MRSERGSVTAEFAVAMPALALVLATCLTGLQVAGTQLRLQDAAALAARALARGDAPASAVGLVAGAALAQHADGDLVCATLTAPAALGIRLSATGCSLGGGR
jgi:Flp pilus assembly protein TadG